MKRIVIFTNIPAPYRVDWFFYLQQNTKEYEIYVVYASKNEDNRGWKIEEEKMKNSCFLDSCTIKIRRKYDTKYIHVPKGVSKILDELHPTVVVGSEYNPAVLQALRYCKRHKIPYVSWTDGTLHSERRINRIQKYLRKYVIQHASAYLASSSKSKEAQLAYGARPERCFVSFLTVDLEKYKVHPEKRERNRILCVGSLIERKGIDLLFAALQGVQQEYTLALAGSGIEEENLKKLSYNLGIKERVEFLGYLSESELKKEYAKSSLFVLPTREDCFALVVLEAMCAGLPVICSKYADGSYDLIENGKNGYIVDPYQTEEFRNCLQRMLEKPDAALEMRQASERILERFQFEEVSKGFWNAIFCVEGCVW